MFIDDIDLFFNLYDEQLPTADAHACTCMVHWYQHLGIDQVTVDVSLSMNMQSPTYNTKISLREFECTKQTLQSPVRARGTTATQIGMATG